MSEVTRGREGNVDRLKERLAACRSWNEARGLLATIRDSRALPTQALASLTAWAYLLHMFLAEDLRAR